MQLWYGRYPFSVNQAEVTSRYRTIFSYAGVPIRASADYDVTVVLDGSGQAALSVAENNLRAALYTPYQDLILKNDDGTASSASLINRLSVSGVRLTSGPDFFEAQGGEFVNRRTCRFTMSAEFLVANGANAIVSWTESVTIIGNGGPSRKWRFPLNAAPIRQVITPYSLVRATQSGMAVGHTKPPVRPLPIWPDLVVNEGDTKGADTPEPTGQAFINYPVRWAYQFENGGPLVGLPSLPPSFM